MGLNALLSTGLNGTQLNAAEGNSDNSYALKAAFSATDADH
jgi:hypothetical protein